MSFKNQLSCTKVRREVIKVYNELDNNIQNNGGLHTIYKLMYYNRKQDHLTITCMISFFFMVLRKGIETDVHQWMFMNTINQYIEVAL